MQSCFGYCILLSLLLIFVIGSESLFPVVKVKLYDSATLPCSEECSGLVTWTVSHKPHDILAQCDQTKCQSKEGFQMFHYEHLEGNHSLTITAADYSKRNWYTCTCNNKDINDVWLQIEPVNTAVQISTGESLVLDLGIPKPVEVFYNGTDAAGPFSGQICTVDGRLLKCKDEYTQRVSLTSALELRAVTPSDSGVYIIMNARNKEVIHTYTVTVQDKQTNQDKDQGTSVPLVLLAVLTGSVCVIMVLRVIIMCLCRNVSVSNNQDSHSSKTPTWPLRGQYQSVPSHSAPSLSVVLPQRDCGAASCENFTRTEATKVQLVSTLKSQVVVTPFTHYRQIE